MNRKISYILCCVEVVIAIIRLDNGRVRQAVVDDRVRVLLRINRNAKKRRAMDNNNLFMVV